jgi:hypothetical protein
MVSYYIVWTLRFVVVFVALLQYPLHFYMVIALQVSNEEYLQGESEDLWGFGQVVALVLVIPVLKECVKAYMGE